MFVDYYIFSLPFMKLLNFFLKLCWLVLLCVGIKCPGVFWVGVNCLETDKCLLYGFLLTFRVYMLDWIDSWRYCRLYAFGCYFQIIFCEVSIYIHSRFLSVVSCTPGNWVPQLVTWYTGNHQHRREGLRVSGVAASGGQIISLNKKEIDFKHSKNFKLLTPFPPHTHTRKFNK
jgi:hypothetical protein